MIRGDVQNIFAVWKALDVADVVVMNLPIVAWKRVILTPLLAFAAALARRKKTLLVAHEWDDLDWRRRLVLMVYALFARRVILSSPIVRAQYLSSAFARMIRRPTSVIPIPPNIERGRLSPRAGSRNKFARAEAAKSSSVISVRSIRKAVRLRAVGRGGNEEHGSRCSRRLRGRIYKGAGFGRGGF